MRPVPLSFLSSEKFPMPYSSHSNQPFLHFSLSSFTLYPSTFSCFTPYTFPSLCVILGIFSQILQEDPGLLTITNLLFPLLASQPSPLVTLCIFLLSVRFTVYQRQVFVYTGCLPRGFISLCCDHERFVSFLSSLCGLRCTGLAEDFLPRCAFLLSLLRHLVQVTKPCCL